MTSLDKHSNAQPELLDLLDAWGGTAERWPQSVRPRIEHLVATTPDGPTLLAQACALDMVLDRVRDPLALSTSHEHIATTDRIVAAALRRPSSPVGERGSADIVQLAATRKVATTRVAPPHWRAAALMAASLAFGVFLGGNVDLAPTLQEVADVLGLAAEFEPTLSASAEDLNDEDTP